MGKLMDVLTRYGDSDTTKDPTLMMINLVKERKTMVARESSNTPRLSMVTRINRKMDEAQLF